MIGANKDWVVTNIPIGYTDTDSTQSKPPARQREIGREEGAKCTADYWMTILIRSDLID